MALQIRPGDQHRVASRPGADQSSSARPRAIGDQPVANDDERRLRADHAASSAPLRRPSPLSAAVGAGSAASALTQTPMIYTHFATGEVAERLKAAVC